MSRTRAKAPTKTELIALTLVRMAAELEADARRLRRAALILGPPR